MLIIQQFMSTRSKALWIQGWGLLQGEGKASVGHNLVGPEQIISKLRMPVASWDYRVIRTRYVQKYYRFLKTSQVYMKIILSSHNFTA